MIGLYIAWGPIAAVAVLAFLLIQRLRPFDFLTSFLIVMIAGSIVNYSAGHLTAELSVLTVGLLFMLFCYVLAMGRNLATITHAKMTPALLSYGLLTLANFARGLIVGNSPPLRRPRADRDAGARVVVPGRDAADHAPRDRRHRGGADRHRHRARLPRPLRVQGDRHAHGRDLLPADRRDHRFVRLPVRAARADARRRWLWLLALVPPLLHQFLSFTRGFWLALIGTTIFSVVIYSGRGPGSGPRWRRSGTVLGVLLGIGVFAALLAAAAFGIQDIFTNAAERGSRPRAAPR